MQHKQIKTESWAKNTTSQHESWKVGETERENEKPMEKIFYYKDSESLERWRSK